MKKICIKFVILCSLFIWILPGCHRQLEAKSSPLTSIHTGNLRIPDNANAPRIVYVDARDVETHAPHLKEHLAEALARGRFKVADSPSNAGYILHVHILKDGMVDEDSLRSAVKRGYGAKTSLKGQDTHALLVDALMVQRRLPEAKKANARQLKNISSRNALGASQMRLAVFSHGHGETTEDFSRALAQELALRMEKGD